MLIGSGSKHLLTMHWVTQDHHFQTVCTHTPLLTIHLATWDSTCFKVRGHSFPPDKPSKALFPGQFLFKHIPS